MKPKRSRQSRAKPKTENSKKSQEENSYYKQYDSKRQLRKLIEEQSKTESKTSSVGHGLEEQVFRKKKGSTKLEKIRSDVRGLHKANYLHLFEQELRRGVESDFRRIAKERGIMNKVFSKTDYLKYLREIDTSSVNHNKSNRRGSSVILEEESNKFGFKRAFIQEYGGKGNLGRGSLGNKIKRSKILKTHGLNNKRKEELYNEPIKDFGLRSIEANQDQQNPGLSRSMGFRLQSSEEKGLNHSEAVRSDIYSRSKFNKTVELQESLNGIFIFTFISNSISLREKSSHKLNKRLNVVFTFSNQDLNLKNLNKHLLQKYISSILF